MALEKAVFQLLLKFLTCGEVIVNTVSPMVINGNAGKYDGFCDGFISK